jgi:hypothetical protein
MQRSSIVTVIVSLVFILCLDMVWYSVVTSEQ